MLRKNSFFFSPFSSSSPFSLFDFSSLFFSFFLFFFSYFLLFSPLPTHTSFFCLLSSFLFIFSLFPISPFFHFLFSFIFSFSPPFLLLLPILIKSGGNFPPLSYLATCHLYNFLYFSLLFFIFLSFFILRLTLCSM